MSRSASISGSILTGNGKVGSAAGAAGCCAGRARLPQHPAAALALPAEDGRLWPGWKRAGWKRGHDMATGAPLNRAARDGETRRRLAAGGKRAGRGAGAALRPGYRAAGAVSGKNEGREPDGVWLRSGIRGGEGAMTVAGVAAAGRREDGGMVEFQGGRRKPPMPPTR